MKACTPGLERDTHSPPPVYTEAENEGRITADNRKLGNDSRPGDDMTLRLASACRSPPRSISAKFSSGHQSLSHFPGSHSIKSPCQSVQIGGERGVLMGAAALLLALDPQEQPAQGPRGPTFGGRWTRPDACTLPAQKGLSMG